MDGILTLASEVGAWDRVSTYCKVASRIFLYFQWVEYEREKYFWTAFHSTCRSLGGSNLDWFIQIEHATNQSCVGLVYNGGKHGIHYLDGYM